MEDQSKLTFKQMLSALLRSNRRHARYIQAFACLAVLVAVAVPLVMRQYGVAMTTTETRLACQYAGNGAHTHNADCYDAYGNLVCPLPEKPFHTHSADCYATERVLTCTLPETAGHAHTEACYDEEGNLTCTLPEEPAHTHTDACYETRTTDQLICGMEETTEEHVHGPACFETVTVELPDPEPEPEPTTTTPAEPEATVPSTPEEDPTPAQEFSDVLKKKDENGNEYVYLVVQAKAPQGALPKGSTMSLAHVDLNKKDDLTGLTAQQKLDDVLRKEAGEEAAFVQTDAVDIAFKDAEGNRVDPAKKVEVRITTANIRVFSDQRTANDEAVANNSLLVLHVVDHQQTKRTDAPNAELIRKAYLVNQDEKDTSTGHEDTIVFEAQEFSPYVVARVDNAALAPEPEPEPEPEAEPTEAAEPAAEATLDLTAEDQPAEPERPAQSFTHRFTDTNGQALLRVDVLAPDGAFPLGTTMQVKWVDVSHIEESVTQAVSERTDGKLRDMRAVDITFIDADGHEIEPAKKITVTFASDLIDTQDDAYVVHVDDEGKSEVIDALGSKELEKRSMPDQADELVIESDAFSTYVVAVTTLRKELAASDGATYDITVDAPAEAGIPQDAELHVSEIMPGTVGYEDYLYQALQALGEDATADNTALARFFDIKIYSGENEVQPQAPVKVSVKLADQTPKGATASAVHFEGDVEGTTEVLDASSEGDVTTFDADGFSVYGVIYTVDFHYDVDGQSYDFSLPGGGFASLSKLVEVLGIEVDTVDSQDESTASNNGWLSWLFPAKDDGSNVEETGDKEVVDASNSLYEQAMKLNEVEVSENTREFIANIEKVEFSNPSLVWVGKTSETTTIGEIKSANELVCEYSAELTEDQISEINSSAVEAADWVLIGVQPFASEETLTITMKNGDQFVIRVTDAQLKKTVISASGETIEVVVTYDDSAEIPVGATLEITEFAEDSDEYQAAREAVVEKKQSEDPAFDDEEFGVAAFDVSIVDEDGNQVEPKATVDVSMKMNSLPEEAAEENVQYSFEIHHFDESSGEVAVENVASAIDGSIQIEEETAQAEFQLESFSTFTISWSENANQTSTTARWTYGNGNQSRVFINVYYVDENGNAIQRPANLGGVDDWQQGNNGNTVNHWLGNDPVNQEIELNIQSVLAKDIPGRTFSHAYINPNGTQIEVTKVAGRRMTDWNYYNSVTYKNDEPVPEGQPDYVYQQTNSGNQLQGTSLYLVYSGGPHTTIHYGYMEDGVFKEFDEQPSPTNTSTSLGWAHLIHDFYGTDDDGPFQYRYAGTYYSANGPTTTPDTSGTRIEPLLRYRDNRWKYIEWMNYAELTQTNANNTITNGNNWKNVNDGSDIYLVYEKPVVTPGGHPTLKVDGDLPDAPNILKQSVENNDGTNTLSLSVTGSTEPMVAEKVADVIVILDLSTSMSRPIGGGDKLPNYQNNPTSRFYQAKQALQKLATELYNRNDESESPQYRLGLITFSNKAVVKQMPTASRQEFQNTLTNVSAHDTAEGTNWEHALMLANSLTLPDDRATYIVFITDGAPTVRQTRLNLTDVQLDGYNVRTNLQEHGDIFHGGLNNGGFYSGNSGYLADRKHFRDYLENASFGGITDNADMNKRNRIAAIDEAKSIISHGKGFFAIGVSTDAASLQQFVTSSDECGLSADHYAIVDNEYKFLNAIDTVLDNLNGMTGQADVKMYDGITGLTQTISKVNQEEHRLIGADGNFTYWKSNPPQATWDEVKATWTDEQKDGFNSGVTYAGQTGTPNGYAGWSKEKKATFELGKQSVATSGQTAKNPVDLWGNVWRTWDKPLKDAYNAGVEYIGSDATPDEYENWSDAQKAAYAIGKKVTFSKWTTREADGCDAAVYNKTNGAVEWNMGEKFMLEDGVTYKVSFICWPSQEAYDIIAKLNNGTITFGDLNVYPQEVWDQFEGNASDGYTLKTNEEHANTRYKSATNVSGNVTVGDEQDPLEFQHVPPMPLDKDKLNVAKTWEASLIDSVTPESVVLQVVGGNELYKQFEIEPTTTVDGSTSNNYGRSEDIYISCGHIKVDRDHGTVVVYESGHDFTLREVEENSRHWDLDASVCRPMKINMEETMLVLVKDEDVPPGMTSDKDYYASGNDEYYRLDGKVYKDTKAWADITGMNTRRSFLDLAKEVLVNGAVWPDQVDEKFTYKIKINVDPTTLSWDPDLEKYVIISVVDANGNTVSPASIIDATSQQPQAKLPSECGFAESNNQYYLVALDKTEFYLSIKNGWNVRFLNLPVGTTYSIEEVLPEGSNYDFNNVRLETRKNKNSVNPYTTQTYNNSMTLTGSIAETSTLYKVVYQNDAKDQTIQILKTAQDATTPLGGAKFVLYTASAYNASPQGDPFKTNLVSSSVEATKGQIDLGSLPAGRYYLVETEAPDGYNLKTDPVVINVGADGVTYNDGTSQSMDQSGIIQNDGVYQLTVTNDAGARLPEAGGPGTLLHTLCGLALFVAAGYVGLASKRTARKEVA